jgi:hypothetical protein
LGSLGWVTISRENLVIQIKADRSPYRETAIAEKYDTKPQEPRKSKPKNENRKTKNRFSRLEDERRQLAEKLGFP